MSIDKERTEAIFKGWVRSLVDSWIGEYTAWDDLLEEEIITEEEYEYIREHYDLGEFEITVTE